MSELQDLKKRLKDLENRRPARPATVSKGDWKKQFNAQRAELLALINAIESGRSVQKLDASSGALQNGVWAIGQQRAREGTGRWSKGTSWNTASQKITVAPTYLPEHQMRTKIKRP